MQVEQNRYYVTNTGDVIGPTWEYSEGGFYAIDGHQVVWNEFGIPNCPESPRLVSEAPKRNR